MKYIFFLYIILAISTTHGMHDEPSMSNFYAEQEKYIESDNASTKLMQSANIPCFVCCKTCNNISELNTHYKRNHLPKTFICDYCRVLAPDKIYSFAYLCDLNQHLKRCKSKKLADT